MNGDGSDFALVAAAVVLSFVAMVILTSARVEFKVVVGSTADRLRRVVVVTDSFDTSFLDALGYTSMPIEADPARDLSKVARAMLFALESTPRPDAVAWVSSRVRAPKSVESVLESCPRASVFVEASWVVPPWQCARTSSGRYFVVKNTPVGKMFLRAIKAKPNIDKIVDDRDFRSRAVYFE